MKIIEALKELPLIEKRVQKQTAQINQYASYVSGQPAFETEEKQKKEVDALLQSNIDLLGRYESLTNRLAVTNASVIVEIEGQKKTIRGWIAFKNKTAALLQQSITALNMNNAQAALTQIQSKGQLNLENGLQLKKTYKEEDKLAMQNKLQNVVDKISSTLEIVNVNTDLAE